MDPQEDNMSETDVTIADNAFLTKYQVAGEIANRVLAVVVEKCVPGAAIVPICNAGDEMITEEVKKVYKQVNEKGVGFPTCISVNNCCGYFSPLENEGIVLAKGDLVNIQLGVNIDGAIAITSHILECGAEGALTDKKADVVAAAYDAAEAVLRMMVPGTKNLEVEPIVSAVCEAYKTNVVEGSASTGAARFVFEDPSKIIPNKISPETKTEEFEINEWEVYMVDVVVSTGEGKVQEKEARTTVYRRTDKQYNLRLRTAREVQNEIMNRFSVMPFTVRHISDARSRAGITEMVTHGLLAPYPIRFEKVGELVAHITFTVLITASNTLKITGLMPRVNLTTDKKVTDPKVLEILARSLSRKKAAKKKAKAEPKTEAAPAKQ